MTDETQNDQSGSPSVPSACSVPRDLLERILSHLESVEDEGPHGEGWQSDELKRDINNLIVAIGCRNPES